eukprot:maker-scaffold3252_size9516-snap-gene-0.3 protein:Tk06530 transcript:maker-scaffold3252_size9516-snap-gene-0.3-mRNA-1 annotation:"cuticle protein"
MLTGRGDEKNNHVHFMFEVHQFTQSKVLHHILPHPSLPTIPSKMLTQSVVLVFSACRADCLALPQVYPDGESPNNQAYNLPADGETLLAQALSLSFCCDSREYGYYAFVSKNCQIFHICLPIEDDAESIIETAQWSFICGNGTMFDQQTLSCNYEADS